jgi:hypothetical protein
VLTCNPGTWTNTPSYGFRWLRDYAPIPGAVGSSYAVQNEDVDHTLACEVTAFNNGGSQTATSNGVSVTAGGGAGGDGGTGVTPTNTAGPSISIADRLLTCHAGTWTGNPSYSYQWLRDGIEIGGAIAVTYTVKDADDGHAISCRVTASNAGGGASATSGVVNVHISAATPPQATVTVATTQDLLLVVNRGSLPVKVSCVTGCTISSVLTGRLPAQSAGRWLARRAAAPVWARGTGVLTKKGIARIVLHLTPAARKRFKHYKVLHLKLVTTVKLKNGKKVVRTKLVTLRR